MNHSIISPNAKIGDDVSIGRFCIIEDKVEIGDRVIIEDYSMVLNGSKIGRGTKIGTYTKVGKNVVIGEDCNFTSFCEIRDNCQLGNNVSMGSRCTLSAKTIVESDVVMKYGFVVTDTPILMENKIKSTGMLKRGSRFGANVVIMPSVTVGANSEIGACSQVRHDVPENEIWYGSPAKFFKRIID
jgi:UDP-2-acetamido-3-amino-2,3-dideoxy-glucuronate N-acetyltransferase